MPGRSEARTPRVGSHHLRQVATLRPHGPHRASGMCVEAAPRLPTSFRVGSLNGVDQQAEGCWVGGQCGSEGGVRKPRVEAWSIRVRVTRVTIGRLSLARGRSAQAHSGTGDRTGRRVNVGGIGAGSQVVPRNVRLLNPGRRRSPRTSNACQSNSSRRPIVSGVRSPLLRTTGRGSDIQVFWLDRGCVGTRSVRLYVCAQATLTVSGSTSPRMPRRRRRARCYVRHEAPRRTAHWIGSYGPSGWASTRVLLR
jgi:hypothetical protein